MGDLNGMQCFDEVGAVLLSHVLDACALQALEYSRSIEARHSYP